jgi:hypothetical protein
MSLASASVKYRPGTVCAIARWKRPVALGMAHQRGDAAGSRRLAEDGDAAGISPERGDVLLHPPKRGDLVEEPAVGRCTVEVPEALRAQSIVKGHPPRRRHAVTRDPKRLSQLDLTALED